MAKSYVELIIELNKEHRSNPFTDSALLLYHAILARFNDTGTKDKPWKRYIKISNIILRGDIRKSYNTYKAALDMLKEREIIDYRSKNGYRDIILSLEPIPEGVSASDKLSADGNSILHKGHKVTAQASSPGTAATERSPGPKGGVIRRQPLSNSPPHNETYSPDGDHPPDDGVDRRWERLKERLDELNVPLEDYKKIVQLSDYGRKEHPVWKALNELDARKGSKDAVRNPGSWIQWYINQAPPGAAVPAVPTPSPPLPESPASIDIADFHAPDDGIERDWDKLKSRLVELKCTSSIIVRIALLSDYGKIGNAVWDALEKIPDKNIKNPGPWISDYIQEHPS